MSANTVLGIEGLIDFHCHLARTREGIRMRQKRSAAPIVAVTNSVEEWVAVHATHRPNVTWCVGLHPGTALSDIALKALLRTLDRAEAVGEVGLDYNRSNTSRKEQRRILSRLLSNPQMDRRLVSLHSAGATSDLISILEERPLAGAILHWFTGSNEEIGRAIDLDVFFSVNLRMLASPKGSMACSELPPNRILLETDAPFGVTPTRHDQPIFAPTIARLANILELPPAEVVARVKSNTRVLLSRLDPLPSALQIPA